MQDIPWRVFCWGSPTPRDDHFTAVILNIICNSVGIYYIDIGQ